MSPGVPGNRTNMVKSSPKPERGSKVNAIEKGTTAPAGNTKVTSAEQKMIDQMADRYATMHGSAGARTKAKELRAKGGDMNLATADALDKAAVNPKPLQGHPSRTIADKLATKVDSRHPGATMSDREFASLQARRDAPFTSATEKRKLTTRINREIEARKAGKA